MRLDEQDRIALFSSQQPAQQLQRFLVKRPGRTASVSEIRDIFSDLSKGAFNSLLISSKTRGYIRFEGNNIVLSSDQVEIHMTNSDIVWKDIRLLKRFTARQICEDTNLTYDQVRNAISTMCKQDLLGRITTPGKATIYYLKTDSVIRPLQKRKKKFLADTVFQHAKNLRQPFASFQLFDSLKRAKVKVSEKYVRELLAQWKYEDLIVETALANHIKWYTLKNETSRPTCINKKFIPKEEAADEKT